MCRLGSFDVVQFDLSRGGIWGIGVWLCPVRIDDLNLDSGQHSHGDSRINLTYIVVVVF